MGRALEVEAGRRASDHVGDDHRGRGRLERRGHPARADAERPPVQAPAVLGVEEGQPHSRWGGVRTRASSSRTATPLAPSLAPGTRRRLRHHFRSRSARGRVSK